MGLGDLHHKNKIRVPRATIKQTSSYSIRILLLFYFCVSLLWFMDYFVVSLLAMTKKQETVPLTSSLRLWNCHCESRYRDNHTQPTPSLRGLEKPVAISVWNTMTVKQNSSLRGFEKAVAIYKKLKIENWKLILHLKLILWLD